MVTWQDEFIRLSERHCHEVEGWLKGKRNAIKSSTRTNQKRHSCLDGYPQAHGAGLSNYHIEDCEPISSFT